MEVLSLGNNISYIMVFIEGVITFVSPCILPMIPLYLGYLAGSGEEIARVEDEEGIRKGINKMVIRSFAFVLGFTIVFTLLGASATFLGKLFGANNEIFRRISGVVIIIFGLNFIGILKLKFLSMEKRLNVEIKEPGFFSSILFGMVFSFGWTPCVGPILGSVLLVAGDSETIWKGILLLIIYSSGLGIPFIVSALLYDKLRGTFAALKTHQWIIRIISGAILIVIGILVLTDKMRYISIF